MSENKGTRRYSKITQIFEDISADTHGYMKKLEDTRRDIYP